MKWTWIEEESPLDNKECLFYTIWGFQIGSQRTDEDDNISYHDFRLQEIKGIWAWIYLDDIPLPIKTYIASDEAADVLYKEWVKRNCP